MPGLSLLHADFTRHDYAPHSHDALVVAVTEAGGAEFTSRGRTEEARAEALMVFNPGEPHSGRMARSPRWRYRSLYLDSPAIAAAGRLAGLDRPSYFTANLFRDPELVTIFHELHCALEQDDDRFRQQELLAQGFALLSGRYGSRQPARHAGGIPDLLRRLIAEMQERHTERLTLTELGASFDLSSFQLIRLFRQATGLTPHAYLTQIRLKAVLRHLRVGLPIAEAAVAAGFFDQSALNRHFRRIYGITPRQFVAAQAG
ncbi:MAG: AraC family transcriptional regulator [Ferrovibrio sp.]|uniref:AraC family transcriptional regulator n=1 Tax=Ferrovibrio sp. TaxID=1917215 RepID=UPI002601B4E5|nr:AraC family transcriptional regulator [Ferrovibrio sp.]MCW0232530.1 AraC family transcriptional regulator [Ferrovibrio sp.]